MISAVGSTGVVRAIEIRNDSVGKTEAAAPIDQTGPKESGSVTTTASELAAQGAPVDTDKVASIRAAIADGSYKVDAKAVADRMIAMDLPRK